ncbi:MAG: hypothetical protein QXN09_04595, partial [Candidatus Caldarchaeum sp.]
MGYEIGREIRDILLALALALAALYTGGLAAAYTGLSNIWSSQLALLAVALFLSRTRMLDPGLREIRGVYTGLILGPIATLSAIIASLLWSNLFPQTTAARQLTVALTP